MKNIFIAFGLISSASLVAMIEMEPNVPVTIGLQFDIPDLGQIPHGDDLELKYVNILAKKLRIDYASSNFSNPKAGVIKRFTEEVIKEAVLKRDAQLPPTEIGNEWQKALEVIKSNARKLGYIATGQQNTETKPRRLENKMARYQR